MKAPLRRRCGRAVAPLLVAGALAAFPTTAPAAPLPHDVNLVNGHLRVAVEYAPAELTEALWGAEGVCGLGERAAARHDDELAAADWTTLGQLVGEVAEADARRVDRAFGNADSTLVSLRARYERRWGAADERSRELRGGVGATRRGIAIMRRAVAGLAVPFDRWRTHDCGAAREGIEAAFRHTADGLRLINVGMLRLWRLAGLIPAT